MGKIMVKHVLNHIGFLRASHRQSHKVLSVDTILGRVYWTCSLGHQQHQVWHSIHSANVHFFELYCIYLILSLQHSDTKPWFSIESLPGGQNGAGQKQERGQFAVNPTRKHHKTSENRVVYGCNYHLETGNSRYSSSNRHNKEYK